MNLENISEDCGCTEIAQTFSESQQYPSHEYLTDFGILAGLIITYLVVRKVHGKVRNSIE